MKRSRSHLRMLPGVLAGAALVLSCAACAPSIPNLGGSGGSGGSNGSNGSNGGSSSSGGDTSNLAAHFGNSGGSKDGMCAAFGDDNALNESLTTYWGNIAKVAPSDIQSLVFSVATAAAKAEKGDVSGMTDQFADNVAKITDWVKTNCS